jgi:hypothetical protein
LRVENRRFHAQEIGNIALEVHVNV